MKNEKKTTQITNIEELSKTFNIEPTQEIKTSNKKLSLKAQIMKKVNDKMHKFLVTEFGEYYKEIETSVVITNKDKQQRIENVRGYYLLLPKTNIVNNEKVKAYDICKPTTYVKGGKTFECYFYKEIGTTTFEK